MSDATSEPKVTAATVAELGSSAAGRFGDKLAARYRVDGEWREDDLRRGGRRRSTRWLSA